jgi:uncharacterized membrane protein YdjX (TVP38/TMEM64 family)
MRALPGWSRWLFVLLTVLGLWAAYRQWDLGQWLTLEQLKASRDTLARLYAAHPVSTALAFFGVYVLAAALSIPGAVVLTLAAGALFGWGLGLVLVSFASSVGALLAFGCRATCCAAGWRSALASCWSPSTRAWPKTALCTC